jgi:hypothetical protein
MPPLGMTKVRVVFPAASVGWWREQQVLHVATLGFLFLRIAKIDFMRKKANE